MNAARSTHISLALLAVSLLLSVAARAASPIAISHATVIDVGTGQHLQDMVVVVTDGRITAVKPARGFHPVTGARVVAQCRVVYVLAEVDSNGRQKRRARRSG